MPFGYEWDDIKRAQQKDMSGIRKPVDTSKSGKPEATEADIKMLKELGEAGIKAKGFYGVLDRLKTSGHIQNTHFENGRRRALERLENAREWREQGFTIREVDGGYVVYDRIGKTPILKLDSPQLKKFPTLEEAQAWARKI